MSDSILYLAIVAIWAGFLIPAWVRRPNSSKAYVEDEGELTAYDVDVSADDLVEVDVAEAGVAVAETYPSEPVYEAYTARNVVFETDTTSHSSMRDGNSEYRDDVHMHSYGQGGQGEGGSAGPGAPANPRSDGRLVAGPLPPALAPRTSQSREQMMRARRRMLTILVSLVFITALFVMTGLVRWWICVPPLAMLVLYVALLREIAIADAELASKKQAWEARQAPEAEPASGSAWKQSHQVWEAAEADRLAAESETGPTAQIIDISSRVGDQLYDQYADAAVRAVGD